MWCSAYPPLGEGDKDGEGQRQPVVVGTSPCMQPWGYIQPDAQHHAPRVSATSVFLFRQTASLLSLLGSLHFHESTSAIFGACVAFFRGRARKIIQCPAQAASLWELPSQTGTVEGWGGGGEILFPEIREMGLSMLMWKNWCHSCTYTGQLSVFRRLLLVSTNFWSGL